MPPFEPPVIAQTQNMASVHLLWAIWELIIIQSQLYQATSMVTLKLVSISPSTINCARRNKKTRSCLHQLTAVVRNP